MLHNDKEHTFAYIIACLIKFCAHNPQQAEQCAIIAHYKGKCDVISGDYLEIVDLQTKFARVKIKTDIEEYESQMHQG